MVDCQNESQISGLECMQAYLLVCAMIEFGLCLFEFIQGGGCMSGLISALPCFCELVATWLGGGGQAHIMVYKVSSHTRFESGHRHHISALPLPLPLEPVLPAQAGFALPHLIPLAPVRRVAGQDCRGRPPRPERRVAARAELHGAPAACGRATSRPGCRRGEGPSSAS